MNQLYKLHNIAAMRVSPAAKRKLYKHYNTALNHKGNVSYFTPARSSYTTGYRCSYCRGVVEA